jgi:outer membrane receptor for ferrienterochelin and colicins
MKNLFFILCLFIVGSSFAQNTFQAVIKDADSETPLVGATAVVEGTNIGATTDANGLVEITNIPDGTQVIVFSYVGYSSYEQSFDFPLSIDQPVVILLEEGEEIEEVTVTATRSTRTIEEIPTRVEFLGAEELTEKAVMNSTNIAMLLRESTGIQMQITSPNSANQSIRIQGLDGRYTQILKTDFRSSAVLPAD